MKGFFPGSEVEEGEENGAAGGTCLMQVFQAFGTPAAGDFITGAEVEQMMGVARPVALQGAPNAGGMRDGGGVEIGQCGAAAAREEEIEHFDD